MSHQTSRELSKVVTNGTARFSETHASVTYTHPGLPHIVGQDRELQPSLFFLMQFCTEARFYALHALSNPDGTGRTVIDWELVQDRIFFVSVAQLEMSHDMYRHHVIKAPLQVKMALGKIGISSITTLTEMFVKDSLTPIVRMILKLISIDPVTRRPKPFPDWYRQKFAGKGVLEMTDFRIEKVERPPYTFVHKTEVTYFDTDSNKHTNFASYMRFAIDGVHKAMTSISEDRSTAAIHDILVPSNADSSLNQSQKASDIRSIHVDSGNSVAIPPINLSEVERNGVRKGKILYVSESIENEELFVHVWHQKDLTFMCSIENGTGEVCCQISLEYYLPLSKI